MIDLVQVGFHRHDFLDLIRLEHGAFHDTLDPNHSIDRQDRYRYHKDQIDPFLDLPAGVNIVDHKGVAQNADHGDHRTKGQLKGTGCLRQTFPQDQHIAVQDDIREDPEGTSG